MTLILTALYSDGACVCADKRSVNSNGESEDDLCKIYSFSNIPLIIFNHGVNKFNNKRWDEYCSEYEKSNRWENKNLYEISEDFKGFIENNIKIELERNFHKDLAECYTTAAFALCGKTSYNVNFKIYELFWSYGVGGLKLIRPMLNRLVYSGSGGKYIKKYIDANGSLAKDKYWKYLNETQAKVELKRLFDIAIEEQKRLGGDEFSDSFDIKCVSN